MVVSRDGHDLFDAVTEEKIARDRDPDPDEHTPDASPDLSCPGLGPIAGSRVRRLATDPDPRMRQLAPRDVLPVELVRRLAADPDHTVRRAIATHPRLPTRELTQLLADPSEWVAIAAAGNPNLPSQHIHRLLALAGL
ncbi:hypothetical protein AB0D57_26905 [Streptomyces sp. NPDC048275]|uniref:hypothetical protein n=1 Tax=Streptomyces sp. NPDC048275 TaxID=3155629 RepID=UPI0033CFAD39